MSVIKAVSGHGIPLRGNDIDTDRIIPARFLRCVTFDGLGAQVFADDRAQAKGQHPFDQEHHQAAEILVVNANFGCGSSREHAPQALAKWGIRAIVGESFAEIFYGNCVALGIPCVIADPATVKRLQDFLTEDPCTPVTVDLETLQLHWGDFSAPISKEESARKMMLSGSWDACGQLIAQAEQIQATAAKLPYLAWK
ncbi:3-isopropylmalate dehydratase small subunit [Kovacikia minuta CCNUW1]|uniref:3-isopropylmalate dehydratase small subunit n=1 Tax=Kovacikia minuta TaxID=2931930 RepID=UPI001CCFAEF1|nr:3-isopropylmalate dehydratase small subunit [Kovacikia minuta]UBF28874.1 3-isopropylmalate dehydratase small subunit [Kovacikia minuta CCNUW1]